MCFYCYYSPKNEGREGRGEHLKFGFKGVFFSIRFACKFCFHPTICWNRILQRIHVCKSTTASPIFLFSVWYDEMDNSKSVSGYLASRCQRVTHLLFFCLVFFILVHNNFCFERGKKLMLKIVGNIKSWCLLSCPRYKPPHKLIHMRR